MTSVMTIILVLLITIELLYFKIANYYHIVDKPNHRSSHSEVTIRGGGVIFCLAAIIFFLFCDFQYPFFILGLFLIGSISFLDDILTLNNRIRLAVHLLSVILLFYQLSLFSTPWYWLFAGGIFIIGTINAYNFMDGINGLTGAYSLLAIGTFYFINEFEIKFTSSDLLQIIGMSLLVFNFFNFRKKAKCFAGDVGSVSMAFIVVFFLGQLILVTGNFNYILFLSLYGLDAAFTVCFRLIRKENIFEAHRSHLYQYLANKKNISHLYVSSFYVFFQLIINCMLIFYIKDSYIVSIVLLIICSLLYLGLRFIFEGKSLLSKHNSSNS